MHAMKFLRQWGWVAVAGITIGCDAPQSTLSRPLVAPALSPGGAAGVKYSKTNLGVGLLDREDLIVLEMDGKRYVFLKTAMTSSQGGQAIVKVSETPIGDSKP